MKHTAQSMGGQEWLLLILLSVVWGGSFFFVGIAVTALPPLTILCLRVCLAATALLAIVYYSGHKMPHDLKAWGGFFCMASLNNVVPFTLIVWGQSHIPSGLASILNATTPMFTIVAAHFLTKEEKITSNKIVGILIGFGGVVVMLGGDAFSGIGTSLLAQCAVLGAALSYAFAGIYGRRFTQSGLTPIVTATGQVTAASIILIPLAIFYDKPFNLPQPGLDVWCAIIALALISTALAYILYFRILATAGATNLLLVTLLIPVSAIVLGTTFLEEHLKTQQILGMGLISLGLLAIDGRAFSAIMRYCKGQRNSHHS